MAYYDSEDQGDEDHDFLPYTVREFRKREHNNMSDYTTEFATGTLYWAKIVGKPVDNYERDGKEWTVDFVPDDTSFLKQHGLLDRLKEGKEPVSGNYLRLRKPELNSEGDKNEPIKIVTKDNQPWDQSSLIGNGTRADVKLTIADWGRGKKKSIWVKAIRITDHVPYEVDDFASMGESRTSTRTKAKAKPLAELDSDLDDEIPF